MTAKDAINALVWHGHAGSTVVCTAIPHDAEHFTLTVRLDAPGVDARWKEAALRVLRDIEPRDAVELAHTLAMRLIGEDLLEGARVIVNGQPLTVAEALP